MTKRKNVIGAVVIALASSACETAEIERTQIVDPAVDPQAELTEAQVNAMEAHAAQRRAKQKAQAQQNPPTGTDRPNGSPDQTTRSP